MDEVRVRFAPSPTGPLHIGGARSALFNYLYAKGAGGKLILRVEDTDSERSSRQSEVNILESLKWLGIDWDEGPDVGGDYGPYRQTERLLAYQEYTKRLLKEGKAYYCYCTEEELEAQRKEFSEQGELPRYNGKCYHLTPGERARFAAEGRKPVVRFHVPENQDVVIKDRVRGRVVFESNGIGDYVLVKSDGIPTYNYAVVIDDHLMKISHVIRAEEHLSNTPRQVLLYEALGWEVPVFAHISLILGKDRAKMSKRHGATSVVQYREEGYLPEAVVNFLALLGWSPEGEEEILNLEEIVQQFSLDRVAKNPAVFDMDKLRWINGIYIRKSPVEKLVKMALPYIEKAGILPNDPGHEDRERVTLAVTALREHLVTMKDIVSYLQDFSRENITLENEEAKAVLREDTVPQVMQAFRNKLAALPEVTPESIKILLKAIGKELKLGGKQVYMPVRIAITGQMHGPELNFLIPLIGKELVLSRIESAFQQVAP